MGGGSPGASMVVGGEGKWLPLVGWGAWSRGLAGGNSDKGPLREVSSGDNGLSVGGLGYCFPSPLPREVSMAPSPDLATSVNGDIVWESLSPASLRGGWRGGGETVL